MKNRMQRLQTLCEMVSAGKTLADIGTDHAFLPIELVREGKTPSALALDIGEGPLLAAKEHIMEAALQDRIKTRISDGFQALLSGEAETAVIAGMGGALIIRILSAKDPRTLGIEELVLGPQSEEKEVRRFLQENGYRMTDERYVEEDGKFYVLIKAENGEEPALSEAEERFGRVALQKKDPLCRRWLEKRKRVLNEILDSLPPNEKGRKRREEVLKELDLCIEAENRFKE